MLEDIRKRLKERRLDVKLTDRAKNYLAETGYDPQYGARPLKRLLSSKLETLLARKIIEGDPPRHGVHRGLRWREPHRIREQGRIKPNNNTAPVKLPGHFF